MELKYIVFIAIIILIILHIKYPEKYNLSKDKETAYSIYDYIKEKLSTNSTLNDLGYPKCTTDENCKTLEKCFNTTCRCNTQDGKCYA
jgi:hypothetical protein